MGMINYVGKFIPNISKHTETLRTLEKKRYCLVMELKPLERIRKFEIFANKCTRAQKF